MLFLKWQSYISNSHNNNPLDSKTVVLPKILTATKKTLQDEIQKERHI